MHSHHPSPTTKKTLPLNSWVIQIQNPAVTSRSAIWNCFWPCQSLRNSRHSNRTIVWIWVVSAQDPSNWIYIKRILQSTIVHHSLFHSVTSSWKKMRKPGSPAASRRRVDLFPSPFSRNSGGCTPQLDNFDGWFHGFASWKTWTKTILILLMPVTSPWKNIMTICVQQEKEQIAYIVLHCYMANKWWRLVKVLQQNKHVVLLHQAGFR